SRRRHTRFSRDWSSDVCSSDLITENSKMSGFVGHNLNKKLKNGMVFGTQNLGRGSVIYLTDNVLFRNFWESGKLIMANATFLRRSVERRVGKECRAR